MILDIAVTPTRHFNLMYIIIDSIFILVLLGLLFYKKKSFTAIFSLAGGVLYFLVDFGYFYLISKSRTISIDGNLCDTAMTAWILLWMSMSYGITNFCFIWLCLKKDKNLKEFLMLIIGWWMIAPVISSLGGTNNIETFRTTGAYHGIMAVILAVGYLGLIIYNLVTKKDKLINILWLNLIGISVQLSWELALLINGIRPLNSSSAMTLIIDSLIETNLGMPYIYLIYLFVSKRINDDLTKVENNEVCLEN